MTTLPFSQRPTDSPRPERDEGRTGFRVESSGVPAFRPAQPWRLPWTGILLLLALAAGSVWGYRTLWSPASTDGSLRIESDPPGASVEIDGSLRGLTPYSVTLPAGEYAVAVTHDGRTQTIAAAVERGVQRVHHVSVPVTSASLLPAGPDRGRLQVISDPPGATVRVDGVARGMAPLSVDDLQPGEHQVVVEHLGRTQRRSVVVEPGATASLVVSAQPAGIQSGWLSPQSTTPLQIYERGQLIGTTDTERILLPAGTHTLEFVADALGFRARRTVTIAAGRTTTAPVTLPQATLNINAVPWAEVWIDGRRVGETPIANLLQTIGTHAVTFRHPEFGEKQATVTVSLQEPARVAVDMRTR